MDVLSDMLTLLQLQSSLYCRSELTASWGVAVAPSRAAVFHLIDRGACWLRMGPVAAPVALEPGDLVFITDGKGHRLSDHPTAATSLQITIGTPPPEPERIRLGGGGATTVILCGAFTFGVESGDGHPLLATLPPVIHLRRAAIAQQPLHATLSLLLSETADQQLGGATIVRRLTDVLLLQIQRAWLVTQPQSPSGWLSALHDPQIGAALRAIHRDPGHAWTVARLADAANLSRSRFAERFAAVVGEPPLAYVTRWRMDTAASLLRSGKMTVAALADQLGYASEGAFSRAFARQFGVAPARYQRQVLATRPRSPEQQRDDRRGPA